MTTEHAAGLLELLRDRLGEILESMRSSRTEFERRAREILAVISEGAASDELPHLVAALFDLANGTPAAGLVNTLRLQAQRNPPAGAGGKRVRAASAGLDVSGAVVGTAASMYEWLAPTNEYKYRSVPVFFASDRAPSGMDSPNRFFTGGRGSLTYGIVRVSIPDKHETGRVERPWILFPESPTRHVTLLGMKPSACSEFVTDMEKSLELSGSRKILVFVHGYNVSFAEAARMLAQFTFDLNFRAVPILYSWPSQGSIWGYWRDETSAALTRENFIEALNVVRPLPADQHVLAHSMGNRVVTQALQFMDRNRFTQVMLAAADEDRDVMISQMKRIRGRAQRNTLYLSTKDGALKPSEWIHGASRGGQTGVTGFDSIDASAVNFSRFGHSYFHEQRQLLNDIFLLVEHGLPPQERPSIRQAGDGLTWVFQP